MYQYEENLDFHALGREIKRKLEEKGWTQEYLAQLVDRTPRSIMYMENRGRVGGADKKLDFHGLRKELDHYVFSGQNQHRITGLSPVRFCN